MSDVKWQFTKQNYREGVPQSLRRRSGLEFWSQHGGSVIGGELNGEPIAENDWIISKGEAISIEKGSPPTAAKLSFFEQIVRYIFGVTR